MCFGYSKVLYFILTRFLHEAPFVPITLLVYTHITLNTKLWICWTTLEERR